MSQKKATVSTVFSQNIHLIMPLFGIRSVTQLAKECGIEYSRLSRMLNQAQEITLWESVRLSEFFDVKLQDLLVNDTVRLMKAVGQSSSLGRQHR